MDLAKDTRSVQVFQATLLTVVNRAFGDTLSALYAKSAAEYNQLAQALLELGRVYARLTPTEDPANSATSTNWLDQLWQVMQTGSSTDLNRVQVLLKEQLGTVPSSWRNGRRIAVARCS